MTLNLLSSVILAAMLGPVQPQARETSIILVLACQDARRMTATIRNAGTEDTAVIPGVVLGNGRKYMVDRMALQARTGSGPAQQYHYHPYHYPSGVAGRVDDWILPLPAGGSFTLMLTAADFLSGTNPRPEDLPRNARLSLRLPLRRVATPNSDLAGLSYFRVWTGSGALTSNEIATPGDCR
jgi:hypothetical protein